jgi:hypothetical protein
MTLPPARNAQGYTPGQTDYFACKWFNMGVYVYGDRTNCDPTMLTSPRHMGGCDQPNPGCKPPFCKFGKLPTPWFAPGTAAAGSPCGYEHRASNVPNGTDGRDLPKTPRSVWRAGSEVEVAWSLVVNHGGGYAYRLCPADEAQTESCFQRQHLRFAGDESIIRWNSGMEQRISAKTLTKGTMPPGSAWRRNPIPPQSYFGEGAEEFPAPCEGCTGAIYPGVTYSIVDRIELASDLTPGEYTLSWRWDAEENPQVWTNCADVRVEASPKLV